jgi:transposase
MFVVDARGLPIRLGLTAGQTHDGEIADTLLNRLRPRTIVLAGKAYDADRIRELIQDQDATPNIQPKSNRRWKPCFSKRLYRERNLIERFFSKLKPRRHPLRQARHQLPRHGPARFNPAVAPRLRVYGLVQARCAKSSRLVGMPSLFSPVIRSPAGAFGGIGTFCDGRR